MKTCPKCGSPNPENAKFCGRCGAPLTSDTDVLPPEPPKSSNSSKWIYIIGGAVIAALVIVLLWVNLRGGEEAPATEDTIAVIPEIIDVTDSAVTETPAVVVEEAKAPAQAEPASSDKFVGSGNIEGYPFSISGKWSGNRVTGTYTNEYNGVKMKVSGYEAEGVLELTLTAGGQKCYFTFDDLGGGSYSGTFNHGEKRAEFQLRQ